MQRLALSINPHLDQEAMLIESHATDSFQNLIFSLLLFVAETGHVPSSISVISHEFKRERFMAYHLPALGWRTDMASFHGIDPPDGPDRANRTSFEAGELMALKLWTADPWGCHGDLAAKRVSRGWRLPDDMGLAWRRIADWTDQHGSTELKCGEIIRGFAGLDGPVSLRK